MVKYFIVVFVFCLSIQQVNAQTDSVVVATYDLVYLKDGSVLKGQIVSFDPSDGDITLITEKGLKYFLTSDDYTAYKENIPAKKRKKVQGDAFQLRERKENQYEFSVGITGPAYFLRGEKSVEDDKHLPFDRSYLPICISAGFGKYIDRKHFLGISFDFDLQSSLKSFYSLNLRYAHQYDAYKKNTSLYIPVEVTFNHLRNTMPFALDETDTTFFSDGTIAGTSYPLNQEYDVAVNTMGISIGQGFGFMLTNKNAISFEVALFRYFGLSSKYFNLSDPLPTYDFSAQGFKMALKYNF